MKQDESFFKHVRGFLTVYLPKNKCYGKNTVKAYRDTINLFRKFLLEEKTISFTNISFDMINHDVIYEFLAWLQNTRGCEAATKNHRLAALKSFFHYCSFEDPALMAVYLDIQNVRSQKVTRNRVEYMSETALKILLEQPDPDTQCGLRDRFFMILLYDTGARIQEILDLRLMDIHLNDQTPTIYLTGKGNKNPSFKSFHNHAGFAQVLAEAFDQVGRYPDQAGGYTGKPWSTGFSNYFGGGAFGR